jgi:2-oxoisovalerate dehydrogenase E2 component (dihydrolipoyl transacylase)
MSLGAEIDRLGALARDDRLSPDDLKGASIVVSNIGSVGGHIVGPVILSPMVAIIGIGKAERVPSVWIDANGNEQMEVKEKMFLSWRADHRVIDGATYHGCEMRE